MTMSRTGPDVLVVGGGVIGCAVAYELVQAGARVTLIARDSVAAHASGVSWGGLYPTMGAGIPGPLLEPSKRSVERHIELHDRLIEEAGVDNELRPVESISLAKNTDDLESLRADCVWQRAQGFDAEMISDRDVYELEPSLVPGLVGGLLQRSHYELDSYKHTLALMTAAERRGAEVKLAAVESLATVGTRAAGVITTTGETVEADVVVLATGPWHVAPLPALPIRPVKGEILRMLLPGDDFRHRVRMGGFNVGRKPDGQVWAGGTEDEAGFDDAPSSANRERIINGTTAYAPKLGTAELVLQTACLRPVSEDGLPLVGRLGSIDNLVVVNGAGKKGVLLSPALAEMAAALALGDGERAPVPAELSVARFGL